MGANVVMAGVLLLICMFPGLHPPHCGSELTVEEFVKNYNSMARFHGDREERLQTDGTFGSAIYPDSTVVHVGGESEDLVLRFEETDGILTKVSFEREFSRYYSGPTPDGEGKQAILFTTMAYAWAGCGPVEAYRSQKVLEEFTQWKEGTLTREILGFELTYTVTPLGETLDDNGAFWNNNWHVEFEFVPNP